MRKNQEPYNIGLDIGTSSIGWSIMNDNFDLMKEECIGLPGVDMDEENGV